MRVVVESMQQLAMVNGLQCRVWEGVTEGGARILLFVPFFAYSGREGEDEAIAAAMVPHQDRYNIQMQDALDETPPEFK